MDEMGFHPVTADEWNNFITRVNQIRMYASFIGIGVSGDDLTAVSPGEDFKDAYNLAVITIQNISGYGTYLLQISAETELTSSLFIKIADELNAVLNHEV